MKHNSFIGSHEARMLRMSPNTPEAIPPQEQPQGEQRFDIRTDQLPEETLRALNEHISALQSQTNETAESELQKIISTAQRDIDALQATPGASKQFVTEYLRSSNEGLHQRKLHMSLANGQVHVSPYNPQQIAPEVVARKNKINELQGKINQVDRNIRELMQGFRENAVRYRGQKFAAMNRGNIAPEINQMLMQFPQASMQASAAPLNQLYALKFRLQQELAGVKSGMIPVSVPGAEQDPSLINAPRFGAANADGTRFDLAGSPGGIGPDGLPLLNAMPTAEEQAAILKLSARWRTVTTEEERDTVEGFLMMDGVDVDGSNLATDEIVMVSPEEKGMTFLVGLITVLQSFLDRLSRKRTEIDQSATSEKDPATMKPEEIAAEKEGNDKKIDELKTKKGKNEKEIKEAEKKLKNVDKPLEGEAKTKVETELKEMKEELKKITEEIEKLEKRNKALANPEASKGNEKDIKTQDQLKDDPFVKDFELIKSEMRQKMRTSVEQAFASGDIQQNFVRLSKMMGLDPADLKTDFLTNVKEVMNMFVSIIEKFLDGTQIEKNSKNEYRVRFDISSAHTEAQRTGFIKNADPLFPEEVAELAKAMSEGMDTPLTPDGLSIVSGFMSKEKLQKEF